MAGADMNIKVTAETSDAAKKVKALDNDLQHLGKTATNTEVAFNKLGKNPFQPVAAGGGNGPKKSWSAPYIKEIQNVKKETLDVGNIMAEVAGVAGLGFAGIALVLAGPLISALEAALNKTDKLKAAIEGTLASSKASVSGDISMFNSLVKIARDETKTQSERQQAIDRLNKDYKFLNGELTQHNINTKTSEELIKKQSAAMVRQAQIKGLQNLITKVTEAAAEKQMQDLKDNLTTMDRGKNVILGLIGSTMGLGAAYQSLDEKSRGFNNRIKGMVDAKNEIAVLQAMLDSLVGADATSGTLFDPEKTKETIKNIRTIPDVLKELGLKIKELDTEETFFGIDKSKEKIAAIFSTIKELAIKFKVDPKDQIITKLFGDIDALKTMDHLWIKGGIKIPTALEIKTTKEELDKEAMEKLGNTPMETKAEIEADINFSNATKKVEEFIYSLGPILADAVTGFAEGIGDAITGSKLGSVFDQIFRVIGQGLTGLGKAMIAYGMGVLALEKIIKDPTTAIIVGAGLVILGRIMQSQIKKSGTPHFANGVQNFSGGFAMVGERGPELVRLPRGSDVIPNHQLNSLGSSGSTIIIPSITLRGQDLVVAFNRANQTINRNG